MRILIVTNLWPSADHPAFGSFVENRAAALVQLGVDVRAVGQHSAARRGRYARLAAGVAAAAVRPQHFDVVEAHIAFPTGLFALPAGRVRRVPVVLFAHGSDVTRLPARSRLHGGLARFCFQHADHVLCGSDYLATQLTGQLGVSPESVSVISPGIRLAEFRAAARRPHDRRGILFVGHLTEQKGLPVLLDAMNRLRRDGAQLPPLTVIGDGPLREQLEAGSRRMSLDAAFLGELPHREVATAMGSSRVVAVPSTGPEGLGLVAVEAMAAGALVVGSEAGGLAELLRLDGCGFPARPGDPVALAEALQAAIEAADDPDEFTRRTGAAAALASAHDVAESARRTVELYRRLLSRPKGGS